MERLIQRLAEASNTPPENAADTLDKIITRIRKRLRAGKPVRLPGLGTLNKTGSATVFRQEDANATRRPRHGRTAGPNR